MTLALTPDTEAHLRTIAKGFGLEPAVLHEDLLQQALAKAEVELNETLGKTGKRGEIRYGPADYPQGNLNRPTE